MSNGGMMWVVTSGVIPVVLLVVQQSINQVYCEIHNSTVIQSVDIFFFVIAILIILFSVRYFIYQYRIPLNI